MERYNLLRPTEFEQGEPLTLPPSECRLENTSTSEYLLESSPRWKISKDDWLKGLTGVTVAAEDILIYGPTRQQHDNQLQAIFQRAQEIGLKLNKDKCKFLQQELQYIEHRLTSESVKPNPTKIKAILDMEPPPPRPKESTAFWDM